MELKGLNDLLSLAELLGVKVQLREGPLAVATFIDRTTLLVMYNDKESSKWWTMVRAAVLLDGFANFKEFHIDHERKVIYVD